MQTPMDRRKSNLAAFMILIGAVAMFYAAAYPLLRTGPSESGRYYRYEWQCVLFYPAAWLEHKIGRKRICLIYFAGDRPMGTGSILFICYKDFQIPGQQKPEKTQDRSGGGKSRRTKCSDGPPARAGRKLNTATQGKASSE